MPDSKNKNKKNNSTDMLDGGSKNGNKFKNRPGTVVISGVQAQLLHRTGIGGSGLLLFPLSDFCFLHSHSYFSGFVLVLAARTAAPASASLQQGSPDPSNASVVASDRYTEFFTRRYLRIFCPTIQIRIGRFLFPFFISFFAKPEVFVSLANCNH